MLGEYDLVYENSALLFFTEEDKRYYENTVSGRAELLKDCTDLNRMDLYSDVMIVWGDAPTIHEDLHEDKLTEMQTSFNQRVSGSFTTSQGYLMQFDTSDSIKMQGAITLMEAVGSTVGYITQANDVTVYGVPIETMKQVLIEMLNAYAQCHARKQELRALINNAQNKEELDEITISWPI